MSSAEAALTDAEALERLLEILSLAGRRAFLYPLAEGPAAMLGVGPESYLSAYTEADEARSYFLDLCFESDLLGPAAAPDSPDGLESLQLLVCLPVVVPAETLDEVARLACVLNLMLPQGAFGIGPGQGEGPQQLVYRYVLRARDRRISAAVLLELVSSACFFIDRMADKLEAVAMGQSTWEDALSAVEQLLLTRPPRLELIPEALREQEGRRE